VTLELRPMLRLAQCCTYCGLPLTEREGAANQDDIEDATNHALSPPAAMPAKAACPKCGRVSREAYRRAHRKRTYYVYALNCDCGSSTIFRRRMGTWVLGPRCPSCRKRLGWMDYRLTCTVRASTEFEAGDAYRRWQREEIVAQKKEHV